MTIHAVAPRPTPIREPIDSWGALDRWLHRQVAALDADCYDGETIQSIGQTKHQLSLGRIGAFRDLLLMIGPMVEADEADAVTVAAEDSVEAQYREAGFQAMDPSIARLMDGDR